MTPEIVWGVCVSFNPDVDTLAAVVASAKAQTDGLIVVDNGSSAGLLASVRELCGRVGAKPVSLQSNRGLASALNVGIAEAVAAGATDVLLLDHDSVPFADMVPKMLSARKALVAQGLAVGAIGAVALDSRTGRKAPFVRFGALGIQRIHCTDADDGAIAADLLITSGTLVRAEVLSAVGPMDEDLFIDHVDTDWCLRARAAGYQLFGACGARLKHRLGDDVIEIGFPIRRAIHLHSPARIYYFVRNSLLLYFRRYAPLAWIAPDAARLVALMVFYSLVPAGRAQYFGAILRAVRDAVTRLVWRTGGSR